VHLLIVEDEPVSAMVALRAARSAGYETVHATSAHEAWELFRTRDDIDVVLSTWRPPGMSGAELCQRVRAHPGRYRPFLFLTASGDRDEQRAGMLAGADDYLVKPLRPHEFELRLIAITRLATLHRKLEAQASELRRLNARFLAEGMTDALTGIGNRKHFDSALADAHRRAVDLGLGYSLAMIDCDWFKPYNDLKGHVAGDRALQVLARALGGSCRDSDQVYRYGGEEFAVLLHTDDARAANRAVERMRRAVERLGVPQPTSSPHGPTSSPHGRLTISAGVTTVRGTTLLEPTQVVEQADVALYDAKNGGRNEVSAWSPSPEALAGASR
jgi:diguanylate cyclase (GGDEF)-like protein